MSVIVIENKFGDIFHCIDNDHISNSIKTFHYFSPSEIVFLKQFLKPNDNVIEIGTNIGCHTISLSKCNYNGKYICFEPQKYIFDILETNIKENKLDNVIALNYALGESNKIIYHNIKIPHENNSGAFTLYQLDAKEKFTGQKYQIEIKNINSIEAITNLNQIKLIKIDVELMEYEILLTMKNIIIQYSPIIFVEFSQDTIEPMFIFLKKLDYKLYWFVTANEQYPLFLHNEMDFDRYTVGDINIVCFPISYQEIPKYLEEISYIDIKADNLNLEKHIVDPKKIFVTNTQ